MLAGRLADAFTRRMKFPARTFAILVALLAASIPAFSQTPKLSPDVKVLRDVPYVTGGHERQKLDLYGTVAGEKRPLLVWIHGGGWEGGNKNDCPALGLVAHGFVVASLNYRLSQHAIFPAQIEDCKSAIRWLRAHAEEYGIDPACIGAWGASAGGHLVALLGTTGHTKQFDKGENLDQSSRVQCVINWFGPTDFFRWGNTSIFTVTDPKSPIYKLLGGPLPENDALARTASPVNFVQKDAAPFLIMHGDKDTLVPVQQSVELQEALQQAGVDSTLDILPGSNHGGGEFFAEPKLKLMVDFVEKHLHVK